MVWIAKGPNLSAAEFSGVHPEASKLRTASQCFSLRSAHIELSCLAMKNRAFEPDCSHYRIETSSPSRADRRTPKRLQSVVQPGDGRARGVYTCLTLWPQPPKGQCPFWRPDPGTAPGGHPWGCSAWENCRSDRITVVPAKMS